MYFVCRNHEKKMLKILHITKIKQKSAMVGLAKKKVQKRVQKKNSRIICVSIIFFSMKILVCPEWALVAAGSAQKFLRDFQNFQHSDSGLG